MAALSTEMKAALARCLIAFPSRFMKTVGMEDAATRSNAPGCPGSVRIMPSTPDSSAWATTLSVNSSSSWRIRTLQG